MSKVKKMLAILLVVLFVATVTASAVSAYEPGNWCGTKPPGPIHLANPVNTNLVQPANIVPSGG